jgi:LAS superfamily LD-carboxypeptidase LdcB
MQETIISDPAKAFGQDMLQDKPQEVVAFEGTVEHFTGTALDVSEGDLAVLMGDDVVLTDDTPVEVTRQILQG